MAAGQRSEPRLLTCNFNYIVYEIEPGESEVQNSYLIDNYRFKQDSITFMVNDSIVTLHISKAHLYDYKKHN
jgi:hypothetical protein